MSPGIFFASRWLESSSDPKKTLNGLSRLWLITSLKDPPTMTATKRYEGLAMALQKYRCYRES